MNLKDVIKKDRLREFLDYGTIYNAGNCIVIDKEICETVLKKADFAIVGMCYETWRQANKVIKSLNEKKMEFEGQRITFRYPSVAEAISIFHHYSEEPVFKVFKESVYPIDLNEFYWTSEKDGNRVFCQSADIDHGRRWHSLTDHCYLMVIGELK